MTPGSPSPLVTVLIAAFNAEATVREAVESALAGAYRNIEIVLVDDGSTDSTPAIVRQLAAADARVRILSQPKRGLSAALNAGLADARGEFVAGLDADDLWHPGKLARQVALATADPGLALVYCWVRYIDRSDRVIHDATPQRFPRFALCRGMYESLIGGASSALMRRSAIVEAGGWDEGLGAWMDLLLQLRISARYPIGFVPEYLVGYRVHPGSLSADPERMMRAWRSALPRLKSIRPGVPEWVHRWAHARRCLHFGEGLAWRGHWLRSALLVGEAMRHDPRRVSRFLGYRTARHLHKRWSAPDEPGPAPCFLDCLPDQPVRPDPYDFGREGRGLNALELRRIRRLENIDRQLAEG